MSETQPAYGSAAWDAERVRSLRGHVGETQREFADRLGTRQQTVSEWETGASRPRAMARRLLQMVAEERGFYSTEGAPSVGGGGAGSEGAPAADGEASDG